MAQLAGWMTVLREKNCFSFVQVSHQLSVQGGKEAIRGDDDRSCREGLPILIQGVQVVSRG